MANEVKVVKSCDYTGDMAALVFMLLNPGKVKLTSISASNPDGAVLINGIQNMNEFSHTVFIVTNVEPKDLTYPEGWYYANGSFRNKHQSTTGVYDELPMMKSYDTYWGDIAKYCTLSD